MLPSTTNGFFYLNTYPCLTYGIFQGNYKYQQKSKNLFVIYTADFHSFSKKKDPWYINQNTYLMQLN